MQLGKSLLKGLLNSYVNQEKGAIYHPESDWKVNGWNPPIEAFKLEETQL
jgi:hypothetical protein